MTSSLLVNVARDLSSILHPLTGTRATGTVTITASGADVDVDVGSYLVPVIDGTYRDDLAWKIDKGDNSDKSWTVTNTGTDVTMTANLGGARFNLADATSLYFDPAISGISTAVVKGAITNGVNPSDIGLTDIQIFEHFSPPGDGTDLARSSIRRFPAAMLAWLDSQPADGGSTSQISQPTRAGRGRILYSESFELYIFTENQRSDHLRRQDGLRLLDAATLLLTSRRSSDDVGVSAPSGIQVRRRFRHNLTNRTGVQRYYAYGLEIGLMTTFERTDTRTYNDLETFMLDVIKPQIPALPNQGDYTVVEDDSFDNG